MAAPNVRVPHTEFVGRTARHSQVVLGLPGIEPKLQKLLAELVMLRLFEELQEAISGVAFRLACGAPYADGTPASLLVPPATSVVAAEMNYRTVGRNKPTQIRWSKATFINDATKHVLAPASPFNLACTANGAALAEMQAVRNRIAHSNANSRGSFKKVVKRHYGAALNTISPGILLLSPRFSPVLLDQYIATCRAIMKGCSRA